MQPDRTLRTLDQAGYSAGTERTFVRPTSQLDLVVVRILRFQW